MFHHHDTFYRGSTPRSTTESSSRVLPFLAPSYPSPDTPVPVDVSSQPAFLARCRRRAYHAMMFHHTREDLGREQLALARARAERGGTFHLAPGARLPFDPSFLASHVVLDQQLCHDGDPVPRLVWKVERGTALNVWSSVHPPDGVVAGDTYAPGPSHTPDNELLGATVEEAVALSDARFRHLDAGDLSERLRYLAMQMVEHGEGDRVVISEPSDPANDVGEEDGEPPQSDDVDRLDLALMRLPHDDDGGGLWVRRWSIVDSQGVGRRAVTGEQIRHLLGEGCITSGTKLYKQYAEDYETVGELMKHEARSTSSDSDEATGKVSSSRENKRDSGYGSLY